MVVCKTWTGLIGLGSGLGLILTLGSNKTGLAQVKSHRRSGIDLVCDSSVCFHKSQMAAMIGGVEGNYSLEGLVRDNDFMGHP